MSEESPPNLDADPENADWLRRLAEEREDEQDDQDEDADERPTD